MLPAPIMAFILTHTFTYRKVCKTAIWRCLHSRCARICCCHSTDRFVQHFRGDVMNLCFTASSPPIKPMTCWRHFNTTLYHLHIPGSCGTIYAQHGARDAFRELKRACHLTAPMAHTTQMQPLSFPMLQPLSAGPCREFWHHVSILDMAAENKQSPKQSFTILAKCHCSACGQAELPLWLPWTCSQDICATKHLLASAACPGSWPSWPHGYGPRISRQCPVNEKLKQLQRSWLLLPIHYQSRLLHIYLLQTQIFSTMRPAQLPHTWAPSPLSSVGWFQLCNTQDIAPFQCTIFNANSTAL